MGNGSAACIPRDSASSPLAPRIQCPPASGAILTDQGQLFCRGFAPSAFCDLHSKKGCVRSLCVSLARRLSIAIPASILRISAGFGRLRPCPPAKALRPAPRAVEQPAEDRPESRSGTMSDNGFETWRTLPQRPRSLTSRAPLLVHIYPSGAGLGSCYTLNNQRSEERRVGKECRS